MSPPTFSSRTERWIPSCAAAFAVASGFVVLAGWTFGVAAMRAMVPGFIAMNPLTAFAFIAAGISLATLTRDTASAPSRSTTGGRLTTAGRSLAAVIALIGFAKLADLLGVTRFQLDQAFFRDALAGAAGTPANRMAPATAFEFVLLGLTLLTLEVEHRDVRPSQWLALATAAMSFLAVIGYLFEVPELYGLKSVTPMALNTALTFLVLSSAILFVRPERGITRVFIRNDEGGRAARRLLPVALFVPALLAWARVQADRLHLLGEDSSVSIIAFGSSVLFAGLVWMTAYRLSRAESGRNEALLRVQDARDELERRVDERTVELAMANEKLLREVDEHLQAEQALRDSEQRYRMLFLNNPHPMWVYDRDTLGFLAVNQAAIELYGYSVEEFLGMSLRDIWPPDEVSALLDEAARPRSDLNPPRELRHVRKDGTFLNVEISSHILEFAGRDAALVLVHDVTGRKHLEAQLRQAQRMDAIGRLAGGVAHDFNNLLTSILGHSQLLGTRREMDPAMVEGLGEIEKAALRATALTRQLLAFSRRQVMQPRVLDLNAVIVDMDRLLRRLIGEDIDLRTLPAEDLGRIKADPGQIEQALVNLVVNARDAMPSGGKLTIETSNVTLARGYAQGRDACSGPCVRLAVSDSGVGMDTETLVRIFEPFFTTKETGRGTGLGLSTVHGIVRQSGGHIEVFSEPGRGTAFQLFFPRVEASEIENVPAPSAARPKPGTETLLVIEDDDLVRRTVTKSLRIYGYTVIETADREDALAHCEAASRRGAPIDLILSDVVMPGMGLEELITRLRATHPRAPILYMSGYSDRAMGHQGMPDPNAAFLQKPFSIDALLAKVRELLDDPRANAA
jgi:PAS domain S-box-containing protein